MNISRAWEANEEGLEACEDSPVASRGSVCARAVGYPQSTAGWIGPGLPVGKRSSVCWLQEADGHGINTSRAVGLGWGEGWARQGVSDETSK